MECESSCHSDELHLGIVANLVMELYDLADKSRQVVNHSLLFYYFIFIVLQ